METRAVLRGVRLSVDKGRLVADLIRGKKVDQALNILNFTQKKAAPIVRKVLMLPDSLTLFEALERFRDAKEDFALVLNGYALVVGLLSLMSYSIVNLLS